MNDSLDPKTEQAATPAGLQIEDANQAGCGCGCGQSKPEPKPEPVAEQGGCCCSADGGKHQH